MKLKDWKAWKKNRWLTDYHLRLNKLFLVHCQYFIILGDPGAVRVGRKGTDSHRTISKNSSGCRLLLGHKKCFVLLCPIGKQCLLGSFCEFVHDGYCLATLAQFVHQGKLLFSTFVTRNEGTTDESKKRLGCYQQEQFNLPRQYSVFDSSKCIVKNKKLKMRRRRESQKSNSLTRQNNNFARASHFFCTFFAVNCTTTRENA